MNTRDNIRINGERLWASLMELARIGATAKGGVCRLTRTAGMLEYPSFVAARATAAMQSVWNGCAWVSRSAIRDRPQFGRAMSAFA